VAGVGVVTGVVVLASVIIVARVGVVAHLVSAVLIHTGVHSVVLIAFMPMM
jgi:hypothetical protein